MNSKPFIVLGEAQESESEEEIDFSTILKHKIDLHKGKIVTGEAPESDDETPENNGHPSYKKSKSSNVPVQQSLKKSAKHQSILAKKLYERNVSLHKNLNDFITQTALNAANELNATNQKLVGCQIQMQEAVEFLKILNSSLRFLEPSLQSALTTSYLPKIKINDSVCKPN